MNKDISIQVEKLFKAYRVSSPTWDEEGKPVHHIEALKNVSFDIRRGESIGIIGPNGSGKSTLLKILAGVTKPTSGTVKIKGRIASILDIGAGFHPELSGRENVFLNGRILGFTQKEVQAVYDQIVEFSGIQRFIDEPVKNYSNGMYLRLAFSIMSHLDFDIYLFDEVFSVGDAEFFNKTRTRFNELNASDKTVVFVSHNISDLQNQDRYILIEGGTIKEQTRKKKILSEYLEDVLSKDLHPLTRNIQLTDFRKFSGSRDLNVLSIALYQEPGQDFSNDKPFFFRLEFEKRNEEGTLDPAISISDVQGNIILSSTPFISGASSTSERSGKYAYLCEIPAFLFNSQIYRLGLWIIKDLNKKEPDSRMRVLNSHDFEKEITVEVSLHWEDIIVFKPVLKKGDLQLDMSVINLHGNLLPGFEWTVKTETV